MTKSKDRNRIMRAEKSKEEIKNKETTIRFAKVLSNETLCARRDELNIANKMKKIDFQLEQSIQLNCQDYLEKWCYLTFYEQTRVKEVYATKSVLQEALNSLL